MSEGLKRLMTREGEDAEYSLVSNKRPCNTHVAAIHQIKEDKVEEESAPRINPLLVPDILKNILSFLDVASLKECRKVSTQWDEEASRILGKKTVARTGKLYHAVEPCVDNKFDVIQNACSKGLYVNFKVMFELIEDSVFQKFLQNIGMNITFLEICEIKGGDIKPFVEECYRILTESCPNLTTLKLELMTDKRNEMDSIEILPFNNPLKITALSLRGNFFPKVAEFYSSLIKSCPGLTSLYVQRRFGDATDFCGVLEKLSQMPFATRKLQSFGWEDWEARSEVLKFVERMQFSSELKTLKIGSSMDSYSNFRNGYNETITFLPKLLSNVCNHVENLNFSGAHKMTDDLYESDVHVEDCPCMPNVKFLSNTSFNNYGGLLLPSFISEAFPNLRKYEELEPPGTVRRDYYSIFDEENLEPSMAKVLNDDEDDDDDDDGNCGIESLNSLVVLRRIGEPSILTRYIESYPNLEYLVLHIAFHCRTMVSDAYIRRLYSKHSNRDPEKISIFGKFGLSFKKAFRQIANLKNLKQFTYFFTYDKEFSEYDLSKSLRFIKNSKGLQGLTIISSGRLRCLTFKIIKKGLYQLAGLPCTLRFFRFYMEPEEKAKMMEFAEQNKINVECFEGETPFELPHDNLNPSCSFGGTVFKITNPFCRNFQPVPRPLLQSYYPNLAYNNGYDGSIAKVPLCGVENCYHC